MLGRVRMSIRDCKEAYINLAERAFTEKNLFSGAISKVKAGSKFQTQPLEDAIKEIVGNEWATEPLYEENESCRV